MTDEANLPVILRPKELKAVYEINLAIVQSSDIDAALDHIILLTRGVFIFDHMVLYLQQEERGLEPAYARVIGRGRSAGEDLAWGGEVAAAVLKSRKTIINTEKLSGWEKDRLFWRNILGLPLQVGEEMLGTLIFARFGGPVYEPEQIRLAEFIAMQISQLLEHHRLLKKVASLEAERQLQRLQDDFIAMVSHEFFTPLGFIKGYVTTLLRENTQWDNETRHEFLSIIDEEADHLRALIDDLIDSYRMQSGTMRFQYQTVLLEPLLGELVERAAARYPEVRIELSIPADVVISGDPIRLTQVFNNLISNVVKYAPGSPIKITAEAAQGTYLISFQDQGPGIPAEHLQYLFERFFRVPGSSGQVHGTGLGLFICRQIIQAHGGEIWAASGQAGGATIWITLPYLDDPGNTEGQQNDENTGN
jgi:signal transduction histidine kinase